MPLVDHFVTKWLETKRLKIQPQRCVRTRNRFSTCHKCTDACPVSAISLENGLSVQEELCTECMKCTVSCPSEAFCDEKYSEYFKEMPNREMISFSCEKDKTDDAHIKLACLLQLDKALLIHAITNSIKVTIQYDEEKCIKCGKFDDKLKSTLDETIADLQSMLKEFVEISYNDNSSLKMDRHYTRRELFSFFSKKMTRSVVSPLISDEDEVRSLRVSLKEGTMRTIYFRLLEKHESLFTQKQRPHQLQTLKLTFNETCDGCQVCARVCPVGALIVRDEETENPIIFNGQLCNGCRSCVDICRKNGVEVDDSLIELKRFLEEKEHEDMIVK